MPRKTSPSIALEFSTDELRTLSDLSYFYGKPESALRRFVGLTSGAETRKRFRFVGQESRVLQEMMEAALAEAVEHGAARVEMTPMSLVATWGRVLSSLNTPRKRRKLSGEQIRQREGIEAKLAGAARELARRRGANLEQELETRRPVEAEWMREALERVSGA